MFILIRCLCPGITKRLLNGFKYGNLQNHNARWSTHQQTEVSAFLESCQLPSEINRRVRGLDDLSHWKGCEYRSFLLYISIVVVKKFFSDPKIFKHFLLYYCAVVICTRNDQSLMNYDVAEKMLIDFLINFKALYGIDHFSSNLHNLRHIVDDVRKFGSLDTISAYPFESKLFYIKRLLRSGNLPLSQVANRITELQESELLYKITKKQSIPFELSGKMEKVQTNDASLISFLNAKNTIIYSEVTFPQFKLNVLKDRDRWILLKSFEIVCLKYIINTAENKLVLYGSVLNKISDYFEYPIRSSQLNIYSSDCEMRSIKFFMESDIYCKMVKITYDQEKSVFIPLYHTIK